MTHVRRFITYQLKRKDPASWAQENPVLRFGEPGVEGTAGSGAVQRLKTGDGVTPWNDLPYVAGPPVYGISSPTLTSMVEMEASEFALIPDEEKDPTTVYLVFPDPAP